MENQMLEMMEKMTGIESEMMEMKSEMNTRFDAVDSRFDGLDERISNGFNETAGLFESADKRFDTLEALTEKLAMQDMKFLKHKMYQIEEDVFMLNKD